MSTLELAQLDQILGVAPSSSKTAKAFSRFLIV